MQPDGACSPMADDGPSLSMSGIPVGPGASEAVVAELETDGGWWFAGGVVPSMLDWLVVQLCRGLLGFRCMQNLHHVACCCSARPFPAPGSLKPLLHAPALLQIVCSLPRRCLKGRWSAGGPPPSLHPPRCAPRRRCWPLSSSEGRKPLMASRHYERASCPKPAAVPVTAAAGCQGVP